MAIPTIPDAVTAVPDSGAAGVDDELLHNIPSPREFIGVVKTVLSESMVKSVGSVYMFQLSGQDGGVFYLDLKNGKAINYIYCFISFLFVHLVIHQLVMRIHDHMVVGFTTTYAISAYHH